MASTSKTIRIVLPENDMQKLEKLSDNDRRSVSQYVSILIEEHIKKQDKK